MSFLNGLTISLRAVEPNDASTLFIWENNRLNWRVSHTEVPFSMHNIHQLIEQFSNLRNSGQLRLIIDRKESGKPVGTIDLFDVNFKHGFATIGILIADDADRGQGIASEALSLCIAYCRDELELRNLQCFVQSDNVASIYLFRKLGFREVGIRKEWYIYNGKLTDEIAFQLCLKNQKEESI